MNYRIFLLVTAFCFSGPAIAVEYFPLNDIRLLDSEFKHAQDKNIEYVMSMEPDRLLAPYLIEAGLEPREESYGNWENSGLNGHIGGHYLSALSLAYAATGRKDMLERLNYMLNELQKAQNKHGNGYLGGVPNGDKLWQQIAQGEFGEELFSLNGYWVPWYNLHKIFAGLRDAWLYTGSKQARDMLISLADWAVELTAGLSDEQMQVMLTTEHGGMNEIFVDVADISGDKRYLVTADRFSDRRILDPLLQQQDQLTSLHANTQIPKVIGFERLAEEQDNAPWHAAANFFWHTVVEQRSVAIGGNSVREHFNDKNNFEPLINEVEGPETCNTYNMLRLTKLLYANDPELGYVSYYERALYNHILSSQNPDTGGLVYFTPMRPQHYRIYSQAQLGMWCCVGSGIENHMKYGEFIYAHDAYSLYVNLYIPSRLNSVEKQLILRQENTFPDQSSTRLIFESDTEMNLKLRYPEWATDATARLMINGEVQTIEVQPGHYITLQRHWKKGDTVSLEMPMRTHMEQLPDGSDFYAFMYGPIVLSAKITPIEDVQLNFFADDSRMGHVPAGPLCPLEDSPILVDASTDFVDKVVRVDDAELRFTATALIQPDSFRNLELIPFFRVHQSRYVLYWPYSTPDQMDVMREASALKEAAQLELERLTIDQITPGEQQPESDHFYAGSGAEAGVNFGRHWRHASDWFGYTLSDPKGEAKYLRIDYWGADRGRTFNIEMNGVLVAQINSSGEHGPEFVSMDYPLTDEVLANGRDGIYTLRFVAGEDSIAGGIYGIRLLNALPGK